MEAIALRLEAIALRLEAIPTRWEANALTFEANALRLEAIALRLEAIPTRWEAIAPSLLGWRLSLRGFNRTSQTGSPCHWGPRTSIRPWSPSTSVRGGAAIQWRWVFSGHKEEWTSPQLNSCLILVSTSFLLLVARHLLLVAMHLFLLASCWSFHRGFCFKIFEFGLSGTPTFVVFRC